MIGYIKLYGTRGTGNRISGYSTLLEAKVACNRNHNCFLVRDTECDGTNSETETVGTGLTKSGRHCVWLKEGKQLFKQQHYSHLL